MSPEDPLREDPLDPQQSSDIQVVNSDMVPGLKLGHVLENILVEASQTPLEISPEKYDLIEWTPYEKIFKQREPLRNKVLSETAVPFSTALQVKFRRCLFGTYLEFFNQNQRQDNFLNVNKFSITENILNSFNDKEEYWYEYNNNLFDKPRKMLRKAVLETDKIDHEYFYSQLKKLRLDDYHVNLLDHEARNFKNLQVLVLCDNWLQDLPGYLLPRRLKFLELYANDFNSVENLSDRPPKNLVHLGLGRNKLTNHSGLHLMCKEGIFQNLKTLDLSDCDIYDLKAALDVLMNLQGLQALQLEGNPCHAVMGYKDNVLNCFPNLIALDGIIITTHDRDLNSDFTEANNNEGELYFHSVKITGIPAPPKEKGIKQTLHFEFRLPLLQEVVGPEFDENEPLDTSPPPTPKKSKGAVKKDKKKGKGKGKSSKKSKSAAIYDGPDEFNPRLKSYAFETEKKAWSKNLTFPAVHIKSPEQNLIAYRDTFRSVVPVKLIYMRVLPPAKKKKGKDKKGKKDKKDKKSKSDKKSSKGGKDKGKGKKGKGEKEKEKPKAPEEEPKETVLKRLTLAEFRCELKSCNWKEDKWTYFWSNDPELQLGNQAVELKEHLQKLERIKEEERLAAEALKAQKKAEEEQKKAAKGKGGKKSKKGSSKSSKSSKKGKSDKKSKKSKKSKKGDKKKKKKKEDFVVCQVNFGLSRLKTNKLSQTYWPPNSGIICFEFLIFFSFI